jgi:choline dehydrogenase
MLEDGTRIADRGRGDPLCRGHRNPAPVCSFRASGRGRICSRLGINVVSDLPGVGENYQDHLESTVQGETRDPISLMGQDKGLKAALHFLQYMTTKQGLMTSNVVECGGFADVSGAGQPDVQFHVLPFMVGWADRPPIEAHGIAIGPCFLRPKSRGSVHLRSSNPKDKALFDAGSFKDSDDLEVLVRGVF